MFYTYRAAASKKCKAAILLRLRISCATMTAMRLISPREYAKRKNLSLGHVYRMMKEEKLPVELETKELKRIPWDDITCEAVNVN